MLEGQQIDRYRLRQRIGHGGMGEVYLAEDQRIGQKVAIKLNKVDLPEEQTTQEERRLFQREITTIARLDHPNILPLFDYGQTTVDGQVYAYLVMPYRQEGTLERWLRQRPARVHLTSDEAAQLIGQAADALQHAHESGIVHQDVKPSNFLIRTRKEKSNCPDLLLADFGIAKFYAASSSMSQNVRGTPAYMAPEQWRGQAVPASDQYALAIMAYQMLTGRLPFQGRLEQVMHQHLQVTPAPPSQFNSLLPTAVDSVLLRALAKEPEQRFESVRAFASALEQAGQEWSEPTSAVSTLPATQPGNPLSPGVRPAAAPVSMQTSPMTPRAETRVPANPYSSNQPNTPNPAPAWQSPQQMTALPISTIAPGAPPATVRQQSRSRGVIIVALAVLALLVIGGTVFAYANIPTHGTGGQATTSGGRQAAADKQVFHYPVEGVTDLKTLDPAMVTTQSDLSAISMVSTGLVSLDDNQQIRTQMAASWQRSVDGLSWTFTLKPDLKFSDGTPITSMDVAYSIDRALQPALKSPASPFYLTLIKDSDQLQAGKIKTLIGDGLLIPDPATLTIVTSTVASYFLAALSYPTSYVVEKKLIDQYGDRWTDHLTEGGSTGPFKVQQYTHGQQIVFVPNPNYYGPKPQLQSVVFTFMQDSTTAYRGYQAGSFDQTTVPTAYLDEARTSSEYHKVATLSTFYYGLNFLAKPFNNIKIRQAFALALNKDVIVKAVYHDHNTPTNHIVPQGVPGYDPNLKGPDGTTNTSGNPTMAKQLLQEGMQEEGYASVAALPSITFKYPNGSADMDNEVAAAVQQWQSVLGISVKAASETFDKLLTEMSQTVGNANLQIFASGWVADYPDPQDFLTLQFVKGSLNNEINYGQNNSANAAQQVQVQQLLTQADTMQDMTARMQTYKQAEQQLVNDVAWLPIYQSANSYLLKPYVVGRVFNAQDLVPPDDWANIYIGVH